MATRKGGKAIKADAIPPPGVGKPMENFKSPMGGLNKAVKNQKLSRKPRPK